MSRPPRVGISHGDINGISYEIIIKSIADEMMLDICTPVIFGSGKLIASYRKMPNMENINFRQIRSAKDIVDGEINVVNVCQDDIKIEPGLPTAEAAEAALASLEAATEAVMDGYVDVLVTAPINKSVIHGDKFNFPGHTEYLEAKAADGSKALMILFDQFLKVALVTTHCPIKDVAEQITQDKIKDTIIRFNDSLIRDFGIVRPKIAVLSLNPHNGDNGLLGHEEQEIIRPAIDKSLEQGILAFGPYPADGFFGTRSYLNYDGVVAMYHDQGLAPFKALAGHNGVNFTAGLPFVRTSPDHGSGYDIAGKGIADATSMREAIYNAIDIKRRRNNYVRASRNTLKKHYEAKGADKTIDLTKEDSEY